MRGQSWNKNVVLLSLLSFDLRSPRGLASHPPRSAPSAGSWLLPQLTLLCSRVQCVRLLSLWFPSNSWVSNSPGKEHQITFTKVSMVNHFNCYLFPAGYFVLIPKESFIPHPTSPFFPSFPIISGESPGIHDLQEHDPRRWKLQDLSRIFIFKASPDLI